MEATVECWHQREGEKGCAEVDEVRKWRTDEEEKEKRSDGVVEISVEEFRELEEGSGFFLYWTFFLTSIAARFLVTFHVKNQNFEPPRKG